MPSGLIAILVVVGGVAVVALVTHLERQRLRKRLEPLFQLAKATGARPVV